MNDSQSVPDGTRQPHTDLHRHLDDGGRHHEITVSADERVATVRLDITDRNGLIVGRVSGAIPVGGLATAADLLGAVLGAAGMAHAAAVDGQLSRLGGKRRTEPWTTGVAGHSRAA